MANKSLILRIVTLLLAVIIVAPLALYGCGGETDVSSTPSEEASNTYDNSIADGKVPYNITVKTEGGMILSGVSVTFTDSQGIAVSTVQTDSSGVAFAALDAGEYTVTVSGLKTGFHAPDEVMKVSADASALTVKVATSVITDPIPDTHTTYQVGDVLYDFVFTYEDAEITLSELLETKKLVILNFWATWCGPCRAEFPALQQAYEEYSDSVAIIAMSISDNYAACRSFKEEMGYTFNLLPDFGLYSKFQPFGDGGIPFTIFVDRYGVFVNYIRGGNDNADDWKAEFNGYVSDSYVQNPGQPVTTVPETPSDDPVIEKPDVSMPSSDKIEAVVNGSGFNATYTAPAADTIWPWVIADDGKSITPSNIGKHSTTAMITTELSFKEGQILAFDYICSIENDSASVYEYDLFSVYVDGYLCLSINGSHPEWQTCYAYVPQEAGSHSVTFYYGKDESDMYLPNNKEYLNIKNLRFVSVDELVSAGASLNVYRFAATGLNESDAATRYKNYASIVLNKDDGYYHVNSANGPILLCKLTGGTQWSSTSVHSLSSAGYLVFDLVDYSEKITEYIWQETHSSLGYCPVGPTLADMLDLIASSLGDGQNHEDEWLEFCGYFDHYGVGDGITDYFDVAQGIGVDSAFKAVMGQNHVLVNQVLVPRGLYYEFVPEVSGVYTFYSVDKGTDDDDKIDTFAWFILPDGSLRGNFIDENDDGGAGENFRLVQYCEAGKKYYVAVAFNSPDTLGEFDFYIESLGELYDEFIACTRHYMTNIEGTEIFVERMYGLHAALGTDGYYHQILSYDNDGTPVLDYSEHGYIYVDFVGVPVFMSFLNYNGDFVTLKDYIENNGIIPDFGFDFTKRTDSDGNSLEELGNHQAEMEAYLAKALQGQGAEYGFVKADERLVDILNNTLVLIYGEYNYGKPIEDQWLMFCNFYRHHFAK